MTIKRFSVNDPDAPRGTPRLPIVYAVMHDGTLVTDDSRWGTRKYYEADLIVVIRNGELYVWKDRKGDHRTVSFDECWERIRSYQERAKEDLRKLEDASCGWTAAPTRMRETEEKFRVATNKLNIRLDTDP